MDYISFLKINSSMGGSITQPVDCLATGPHFRPKRVFLTQRSTASSLKFMYLLVSLRPSSRCLQLLPRLPVTCILPSVFPSVNYKFLSSALDVCGPITSHFCRFNTRVPRNTICWSSSPWPNNHTQYSVPADT
jgi:hypothetical protein